MLVIAGIVVSVLVAVAGLIIAAGVSIDRQRTEAFQSELRAAGIEVAAAVEAAVADRGGASTDVPIEVVVTDALRASGHVNVVLDTDSAQTTRGPDGLSLCLEHLESLDSITYTTRGGLEEPSTAPCP